MSTYYGLFCKTDGAVSPCWFRKDYEESERVAQAAEAFASLAQAYEGWRLEMTWLGVDDEPLPHVWVAEHVGHTLEVRDEYDRRYPIKRKKL